MGVMLEIKAWVSVGKSVRLRLVIEGKAKKTSREESTQREPSDSLRKDKELGSKEAGKKGGKETNGREEPNTNRQTGNSGGNRAAKGEGQLCERQR